MNEHVEHSSDTLYQDKALLARRSSLHERLETAVIDQEMSGYATALETFA